MFGWLTGNGDRVERMAKGVGSWIDEQQLTDQERAEMNFELLEWRLRWLNATQGMNLARRILAFGLVGSFLLAFLVALIGVVFQIPGLVEGIVELVGEFGLPWIVGTIVVFYYGEQYMEINGRGKRAPHGGAFMGQRGNGPTSGKGG